jgi:hypothetical protein
MTSNSLLENSRVALPMLIFHQWPLDVALEAHCKNLCVQKLLRKSASSYWYSECMMHMQTRAFADGASSPFPSSTCLHCRTFSKRVRNPEMAGYQTRPQYIVNTYGDPARHCWGAQTIEVFPGEGSPEQGCNHPTTRTREAATVPASRLLLFYRGLRLRAFLRESLEFASGHSQEGPAAVGNDYFSPGGHQLIKLPEPLIRLGTCPTYGHLSKRLGRSTRMHARLPRTFYGWRLSEASVPGVTVVFFNFQQLGE